MPPVSQKQRAAMAAAKAGKSTLGIPKKVGADFMAADPGGKLPMRAASEPAEEKGEPKKGHVKEEAKEHGKPQVRPKGRQFALRR
jgi:hypothetical protein